MSGPDPRASELPPAASLEPIAELERRCLPDPWSLADLRLYAESGAVAIWQLPDEATRLPAAYAVFQLLPGECELLRLGVDPARRRRGLARALLSASLAGLAAAGRPRCHLEVRAGNLAARGLYESLGFHLAGRRRAYYADGEDALRYARESASPTG